MSQHRVWICASWIGTSPGGPNKVAVLVRIALLLSVVGLGHLAGCKDGGEVDVMDAPKPDIIVIVIDTWRWDRLGANRGVAHLTPALDDLTTRGLRFERAYSTAPWTLPSLASLLTGEYPTVHGAFGPPRGSTPLRPTVPTLAERLGAIGYRTVAITNVAFLAPKFGLLRGFQRHDHHPASNVRLRRAGPAIDSAIQEIDRGDSGEPLFLFLHLFDPHLAYDPPPDLLEDVLAGREGLFRLPVNPIGSIRRGTFAPSGPQQELLEALYDAEVVAVDRQLKRLFDRLDTATGDRETFLLVTSDHGEEFGEHGGWEHGHSMHQELTRVPLIVVPPTSWGIRAATTNRLTSLTEIAPTVLKAAGLPASGSSDLLAISAPGPDGVLSERGHFEQESYAFRTRDWTLIVDGGGAEPRLYEFEDEAERSNVARQHPDVLARLMESASNLRSSLEEDAKQFGVRQSGDSITEDLQDQLEALGYVDLESPNS